MSTYNRIVITIGVALLSALGGAMTRDTAEADEPVAPITSPAVTPSPPQERYLLLSSGQLVRGIVTENEAEYLIEQRVGVLRFAKRRAEGAFNSIRDAYDYRLAQLPEGDFDEAMKLAFWCLNLKLTTEATAILTEVVKHNPTNQKAKSMLVSIEQATARASLRQIDSEVRQTRAEERIDDRQTRAGERADRAPAALDSGILNRARRGLGISDLPVIFDLPTPLAIKRSGEFFNYVHPLLQKHCARCHDGQYDGSFQLVPIKSKVDRTPDALRANLDATLRLVDPNAPSHSELLSSTLRPHGRGPRPKPIFAGSNDPTYRILAAWANSLSPPKSGSDVVRASQSPTRFNPTEPFARDRNRASSDDLNLDAETRAGNLVRAPLSAGTPAEHKILPPSTSEAGRASTPEAEKPGDPHEFPLPFVITGVKPNAKAAGANPRAAAKSPSRGSTLDAAPAPSGSSNARSNSPAKSHSPADPAASADKVKGKNEPDTAKKPTTPLKLDPKLLERALQSRNLNRQKASGE